jgi:hypothetical protein
VVLTTGYTTVPLDSPKFSVIPDLIQHPEQPTF